MENQISEITSGLAGTSFGLETFFMVIMGALVMWMAAGFAMLESGLVRAKNTTEILTKNIVLYGVACVMYLIMGYHIMYTGNGFGWFLSNISTADAGLSYANGADFFFQVVFVATAMSIVSGAVAERMKLWSFLVFACIMCGYIYPMEGAWTWGGSPIFGIFQIKGDGTTFAHQYQDFAGSGIVHLAGAAAALAGVLLLGARKGKYGANGQINAIPGANLPLATLGTFILWLGWFGFNGGSQLAVGSVSDANAVAMTVLNTNAAAAGGLVAALIVARILFGKADLTMSLNGCLAGLVAITAGPDSPSPLLATLIGVFAGVVVVFAIVGVDKLKIDDPVGAVSVHGVSGLIGIMAVPLSSDAASFGMQALGAAVIFVWVFVVSLISWFIIKLVIGIRVSEEEELEGTDISECGMEAYPEFTGSAK